EMFRAQVAAQPSAVAVMDPAGHRLTYQELADPATQLARHLTSVVPVLPDTRIALLLETGVGLAVAVLAVLQAGAAYLPLDQQHPADRMLYLLQDAGVTAVITDAPSAHRLPAGDLVVIDLDADAEAIGAQPTLALPRPIASPAFAYAIYT